MAGQNDTIKIIKRRRSVRNYKDEPIPEDALNLIIEAGLYAPHGGGNIEKDIFFTVIQNKEIFNKINFLAKEFAKKSEMEWLQALGKDKNFNCLYNAPALIVLSYKRESPCAVYDCSAVTQNMLLASESLGLGSCWLYFPLQAFEYEGGDELLRELKIPEGYKPVTSMILGHKANTETDIVKRTTENIRYIK
jgi:nitroreductase